MNTNHRITGSNSSLTLSGDNTKTLCQASKDISNYNQRCILSEKPFLMGLLLLLLKARPVFPLGAGNRINLFVITLLPAPLEAQENLCPSLAGQAAPQRVPRLWIQCSQADELLPPTGTCCQPWAGDLQAPSLAIRLQAKPSPSSSNRQAPSETPELFSWSLLPYTLSVHREPDKAGIHAELQIFGTHFVSSFFQKSIANHWGCMH